MKLEFKTFPFAVKLLDESTGEFEGYASTFGNVDLGGDIVDRGAFKKTLQESKGKIPILADHDPRKQIGWNLSGKEDKIGLAVKGWLNIKEDALARSRFSLMQKALDLDVAAGLSIGYLTIKAVPDKENPTIRRLKELRLYEYSQVAFPMNTEAMVTGAKDWLDHVGQDDIKKNIDLFLKSMLNLGYEIDVINSALALQVKAAEENNPNITVQLFEKGLDKLKQITKGV